MVENHNNKIRFQTYYSEEEDQQQQQQPLPQEEERPPPKDDVASYKWRLDPDESFSDWTIEVVVRVRGILLEDTPLVVERYHVHKNYLAVGGRKSEYFANLFRNAGHFKESQDCTSRIELDPLAAASFPTLLDYVYAPEKPLVITTQTATALHYLGEYFEMKYLRWDAKEFILKDLSMATVETYYQTATLFQNEAVISMVADFLGKNVTQIDPYHSPLVQNSDPELWVKISKSVPPGERHSKKWSRVVAQVGRHHTESLDTGAFQSLTSPSKMPQVDPNVALALCDIEDNLEKEDNKDELLTSLQERCADALAVNYDFLLNKIKEPDTIENLKSRNSIFLVDLLVKSLQAGEKLLQDSIAQNHQNSDRLAKAERVIRRLQPVPANANIKNNGLPQIATPVEIKALHPNVNLAVGKCYELQNGYYVRSCPVFYYDILVSNS